MRSAAMTLRALSCAPPRESAFLALLHAVSITLCSADGTTTTLGQGEAVVVEGAGGAHLNGLYKLSTPHPSHTWVDASQNYYVLQGATSGTQTGLIDLYYNQDFGGWRIAADGHENYNADCLFCTWSVMWAGIDPAPSVSAFGSDHSTTEAMASMSSGSGASLSMFLASLLWLA